MPDPIDAPAALAQIATGDGTLGHRGLGRVAYGCAARAIRLSREAQGTVSPSIARQVSLTVYLLHLQGFTPNEVQFGMQFNTGEIRP
jgi:hypothetical protein